MGLGIIDARNIWHIRPEKLIPVLQEIVDNLHIKSLDIQPSASLQFVTYDAQREKQLPIALRNVLSFAERKLKEVVFVARTITGEISQCFRV